MYDTRLEQDAASALRSAMTEAAGEYKTQLAALQAENETLKDLRKTELKQGKLHYAHIYVR